MLYHLLAEYDSKYELNLPIINQKEFRTHAERIQNHDALKFINWYEKKLQELRDEKTCGKFMRLRHENTHISTEIPRHYVLLSTSNKGILEIVPTAGNTLKDKKYNRLVNKEVDKFRNDVNDLFNKYNRKPIRKVTRDIILFIPDIGYFHIHSGCAKFLREVKKVVTEVYTNFPLFDK